MKIKLPTDIPEHALREPWRTEGAENSDSREIHSITGWHLCTVKPSGALTDNDELFRMLAAVPELIYSLRQVLDLIDRAYVELEDDDADGGILETAYELLRKVEPQ